MNGLVLVDKPSGITSHDVVNRWRKLAATKRVGHLGTLDPMATGLLALVTGNATRLARFFEHESKTYVAEATFGFTSSSYDGDGEITPTGAPIPSFEVIRECAQHFVGKTLQTPPAISAKKLQGVPAYKLARRGVAVELKPVAVEIFSLVSEAFENSRLTFTVRCSAGTYIRSLTHDLGSRLGCGAFLSSLRRTAIGTWGLDGALTIPALVELAGSNRLPDAVVPMQHMLPHFPAQHFTSTEEVRIRQGRDFRTSPFVVPPGEQYVKALADDGRLIAIGELKIPNLYHPSTVL